MEGKKRQSMHQERDNLGLTIGWAIVGTILANILIGLGSKEGKK